MIVLEFKLYGRAEQFGRVDEAIRTAQFIRNKSIRHWMDAPREAKIGKYDLNTLSAQLAKEYPFAARLNSMARQACAERAWSAISNFYAQCKKGVAGKKGFPKFKKNQRSVEYKTTGWKLNTERTRITFTDGHEIGELKLKGSHDIHCYQLSQFKRVRIVKRADGYYAQFCIDVERAIELPPSNTTIGLDVGLKEFYTDSNGDSVPNPRFLGKSSAKLRRAQRKVSKKFRKGKPQSQNYKKAKSKLARVHLKVQRQRKDHAIKLARCVVASNDVTAFEDLQVSSMVKNRKLAKSINDAGWTQFKNYLVYYGKVFGRITVAVPPQYTSQDCSTCGNRVKKSLSTRTHVCNKCKTVLDRDHNAAINILRKGLRTVGHTGINAWGEDDLWSAGSDAAGQVASLNQEAPLL
jgi:putative transposase